MLEVVIQFIISIVAFFATKNWVIAGISLLVASAIYLVIRLRSLSGWNASLVGVLALFALLLVLMSGAADRYYTKKQSAKPQTGSAEKLSLKIGKVELLNTERTVKDFKVSGTVSNLGLGETIWVANLAKSYARLQHIDESNLTRAKVYPAFGPCRITGHEWSCDEVYVSIGEVQDYFVLAYRVPSDAARDLIDYQKRGTCNNTFPPITMPRDAQLADYRRENS